MKHVTTRTLGTIAVWVGIGTAALSGCAVGPDYTPPEMATSGQFRSLSESQPVSSRLVAGPARVDRWWALLSDPMLDSLVERAVSANLDLRIAATRLSEARALRGTVAAEQFPRVDAGAGYERYRSSENTSRGFRVEEDSSGADSYRAGFDASWEIDLFGRVKRSVEAADADVSVAAETLSDVLVSLVAETARNYSELRAFQRRLAVTEFAIQTERDTLALVEARLRAGLATELDVAQARTQLSGRMSQLPPLRVGVRRSSHRLAVLIGQEPGALLDELAEARPIPPVPAEVAVGVPADLIRRRPDIRRSEREIAAATARVGVATADLYPRFTLLGSFGLESGRFGDLFDLDSRRWSIGPSMSWPVFDGGRIRSTIRVRDAQLERALLAYEKSVLVAFEEVENAMVAFIHEQGRRVSLSDAVDSSTLAVELARERYQNGLVDFLNVLDSQRLLYLAQDELVLSEQTVTVELIALFKALGGGWEPAGSGDGPSSQPGAGLGAGAGAGDQTPESDAIAMIAR